MDLFILKSANFFFQVSHLSDTTSSTSHAIFPLVHRKAPSDDEQWFSPLIEFRDNWLIQLQDHPLQLTMPPTQNVANKSLLQFWPHRISFWPTTPCFCPPLLHPPCFAQGQWRSLAFAHPLWPAWPNYWDCGLTCIAPRLFDKMDRLISPSKILNKMVKVMFSRTVWPTFSIILSLNHTAPLVLPMACRRLELVTPHLASSCLRPNFTQLLSEDDVECLKVGKSLSITSTAILSHSFNLGHTLMPWPLVFPEILTVASKLARKPSRIIWRLRGWVWSKFPGCQVMKTFLDPFLRRSCSYLVDSFWSCYSVKTLVKCHAVCLKFEYSNRPQRKWVTEDGLNVQ